MIIFDETRELHPMRECIGKTIVGTGNSATNISLTFDDGTALVFNLRPSFCPGAGYDVHVSLQERP